MSARGGRGFRDTSALPSTLPLVQLVLDHCADLFGFQDLFGFHARVLGHGDRRPLDTLEYLTAPVVERLVLDGAGPAKGLPVVVDPIGLDLTAMSA